MRPTNAQILEGRDEALEHLGISLVEWETFGPRERRDLLKAKTRTDVDLAAAWTVIEATDIDIAPFWVRLMWSQLRIDLTSRVAHHYAPTRRSKLEE